MKPGDVCLAQFPFAGKAGRKLRPVVVLTGPLGSVPEYVTAYVTSVTPTDPMPSDRWINPADSTEAVSGLTILSVVRMHKISTIHERDFIRTMGTLPTALFDDLRQRLRQVLRF